MAYPWQQNRAPQAAAPAVAPAPTKSSAPAPSFGFTPKQKSSTPPPASDAPLTIVRLTAENVKRLRAVTIAPDGNLVVLSGRNGQGKTSVLDAIEYALGGKPSVAEPVRRGEESAEVVCDLGDLIVRRRFTATGGTSLEVTSRDGLRYPSPQKILDELVGRLTFDPLAFARMEPKKQRETLQELVGIDVSATEKRAGALYSERTLVNRDLKAAQAKLAGLVEHAGVPAEPVSAAAVAKELADAQAQNMVNNSVRDMAVRAKRTAEERTKAANALRKELALAEEAERSAHEALERSAAKVEALQDVDLAPINARLATIDQTNAKVRDNQARKALAAEVAAKDARSEQLTSELRAIDEQQAAAIAAVEFPVDGLGCSADGVTLAGIPLEQASAAEQLRVSVAIALAMNPKLRVLLIRDASLLDHDSMRLVAEMAQAAGAQVWMERVESDDATSVVIEDGQIVPEEER